MITFRKSHFGLLHKKFLNIWEVKSVMTFDLRNPDFQVYSWIKKLEDDIAELNYKQAEMEKKLKESVVKG